MQNKPVGSVSEAFEAHRAMMALIRLNEVKKYVTITHKTVIPAKPRLRDGQPVTDSQGNQLFYDPSYKVAFSFFGGSSEIEVKKDFFDQFDVNESYIILGREENVVRFGKSSLEIVYHSIGSMPSFGE